MGKGEGLVWIIKGTGGGDYLGEGGAVEPEEEEGGGENYWS